MLNTESGSSYAITDKTSDFLIISAYVMRTTAIMHLHGTNVWSFQCISHFHILRKPLHIFCNTFAKQQILQQASQNKSTAQVNVNKINCNATHQQ